MESKRGRKRKNEMYFGPEEEEAVIKFLNSRHIEIINFISNQKIVLTHKLGDNIIIDAFYEQPNEKPYGNDKKIETISVEITSKKLTSESVEISTDSDINNVTVIIINEIERNALFNEWLKAPLDKMVEAIIRRYKLYRKGFTFEELHGDAVSFLMTKVHKFEAGRGKKAYSYFGTIAKNYMLGLLIKDEKYMKQTASYEDISQSCENDESLSYTIDGDKFSMDDFIQKLTDGIKYELDDADLPPKKQLNENERKVGYALIEILENWEEAFQSMDGGAKYNKNSVLETMRNYTGLSTKDIRIAMKRFKELYELLKHHGL